MPKMKSGDVLGREFMGEVVEVGAGFSDGSSAMTEKALASERAFILDPDILAIRPGGAVSAPGICGGPVTFVFHSECARKAVNWPLDD